MLLSMARVQEINTAEFSQSKQDILNVLNTVDCSSYPKRQKKDRNYYNLRGVFCKAEYALIHFQKPVANKKKQAECRSFGNDRYASVCFIYRVGVEHYC